MAAARISAAAGRSAIRGSPYTLHVRARPNNTHLTLAVDSPNAPTWQGTNYKTIAQTEEEIMKNSPAREGQTIFRLSTGMLKFKGAQRSTFEAATQTALLMFKIIKPLLHPYPDAFSPFDRRAHRRQMTPEQEDVDDDQVTHLRPLGDVRPALEHAFKKVNHDYFKRVQKDDKKEPDRKIADHISTLVKAPRIHEMTVSFEGFGQGREAVYAAIISPEGRHVLNKITALEDVTPIKIGGSKARKRRVL